MSVSELEKLSRHFDGPPSFKMSAPAPITSSSNFNNSALVLLNKPIETFREDEVKETNV